MMFNMIKKSSMPDTTFGRPLTMTHKEAWAVLIDNDDVEHMWKLWNQTTEIFLSTF